MSGPNVPATIESRVREKIDVAIAELIPEDELVALVRDQVAVFKRNTLPGLIQSEIKDHIQTALRNELNKVEYSGMWDGYGQENAAPAVRAVIEAAAPQILALLMSGVANSVVQSMRNALQNRY